MGVEREFVTSGFFALRTPLLPFSEWQHLGPALGLHERSIAEARLRDLVSRPEVREAIFLASPSLDEGVESWLREGADPEGKIRQAALRYVARMAGRATPFGLFAGLSLGHVGEQTHLRLAGRSSYVRHTRLDADYLFSLTEELAQNADLRASILFYPNTILYRSAERWRYVEARSEGSQRRYHLVAADATDYLDATLERASGGQTIESLATALVASDPEGDLTLEEASEFVLELVASQLLVSRFTPSVTGGEPLRLLIADLNALANGAELGLRSKQVAVGTVSVLLDVQSALTSLDQTSIGAPSAQYRRIAERLGALPTKVDLSRLFQVDMAKPATATLGPGLVAEFARGIDLLHALSPSLPEDQLSRFRDAFSRRYGDREAPLLEVLDEELGIGFEKPLRGGEHTPLLAEIALPAARRPASSWSERESFLLRRLQQATAAGALEIRLSAADTEALRNRDPLPLPEALCVMGTLLCANEAALESGAFRLVVNSVSGPSGARLLGRFCHLEPQLRAGVEAHLRAEEACRPDAVFAEVVHLPEGRLGNVVCRPVLRGYEIVFGGRSAARAERQIPLTDLSISVRNARIVVRSKRLNREVIPRLSNAHNFAAKSIGPYRFLCALQQQGTTGALHWSWGALAAAAFLPRVTSGRLILSRATWNLDQSELERLNGGGDGAFEALRALRSDRSLPRWLALQDADNELPLDLDNALSIEMFVQLVRRRSSARLVEMFPDELCVEGPEGHFIHELVLPFVRRPPNPSASELGPPQASKAASRLARAPTSERRTFLPGSEWLYAKLYTGTATADHVLVRAISPLVARLKKMPGVQSWFFVRYGDPDWHLRFRCRGEPSRLDREVLPLLHELTRPLADAGQIWKLQIDTYEREVERYGGPQGVAISERLFQADSEAVVETLEWLAGTEEGEDLRWRIALSGMDSLLNDLGFALPAKLAIVEASRRALSTELREDVALKRSLGDKYRKESKALASVLEGSGDASARLLEGAEILRRRSQKLLPIVAELHEAERHGYVPAVGELAQSYLHMHANRLFRADARAQEFVLYDFMARLYRSKLARDPRRHGE
jgi:thiopeptide-type bacteriocin biosynthesis protein